MLNPIEFKLGTPVYIDMWIIPMAGKVKIKVIFMPRPESFPRGI